MQILEELKKINYNPDNAIDEYDRERIEGFNSGILRAIQLISTMSKGKWIREKDMRYYNAIHSYRCSNCSCLTHSETPFCPNCGKPMEVE